MIFRTLEEYCQLRAIEENLLPNEEARWRKYCRHYSKAFNTPLQEVYKLDPEEVLLSYFGDQYDEADLEENIDNVLDLIYRIEDPEYGKDLDKEEGVKDYLAKYEAEKAKSKKALLDKQKKVTEKTPVGGSVDFSNLKDDEKPGKF